MGPFRGPLKRRLEYQRMMDAHPLTAGMEWKVDAAEGHVFPKLSIKSRDEVVRLGLGEGDFSPLEVTG